MEKVKHSDMKANQEPLLCRLGEVIKNQNFGIESIFLNSSETKTQIFWKSIE